jgi:hypothetical protein
MFQLIEFFKKRPSDMTIRIIRILFSLGIASLLVLTAGDYTLPFQPYYEAYALYAKYALAAVFVLHAIVFGFVGICFCKRTTMKRIQMIVGLLMIIAGNLMGTVEVQPTVPAGSTVSLSSLGNETREPVDTGFYVALLGFLPLLSGITGKMIMSKCMKHGEAITKIRV